MPDVVDFKFARVRLFLLIPPGFPRLVGLLGRDLLLLALRIALPARLGQLSLRSFFLQVMTCQGRRCTQHRLLAFEQTCPRSGEMLLALRPFPTALLQIGFDLGVLGTQSGETLFDLGQGDFRGRTRLLAPFALLLAVANLAVVPLRVFFEALELDARPREPGAGLHSRIAPGVRSPVPLR